MRNLRQKTNNGLGAEKTQGQIQPNRQKEEIPKSPMGAFGFRQKSQGLHQVHQNTDKEKLNPLLR